MFTNIAMPVYTVILRPSPKGLSREELTTYYLEPYGKVSSLRFGTGHLNDYAYVDFETSAGALKAVKKLQGEKFNGSVRCSAALTPATEALIEKDKSMKAAPVPKRLRVEESTIQDAFSFGRYKQVGDLLVYSIR